MKSLLHSPKRSALSNYRIYKYQIERLHEKYLFAPKLYDIHLNGVSLASFIMNAKKVSKLIAKSIQKGQYKFGHARTRIIISKGKERVVYSYRLDDLIVLRAVAEMIHEATLPVLSSRLYSYRKGVSWWQASTDFADYVRVHRKHRPDPRTRGIYVLRIDIDTYTDSIPVGQKSQLWEMLNNILPSNLLPTDYDLIEKVIRPEIKENNSWPFSLIRGIPTGQPIASVLYNYYLTELDKELEKIPGSFYARYSDDLIFAHSDVDTVNQVNSRIQTILSALDLKANAKKSKMLYLTAAGRKSSDIPESIGTSTIEFVGLNISADGTVSLSRNKTRAVLQNIKRCAVATVKTLGDADMERVGRITCSVINGILEPRKTPYEQRSASLLRYAVTDRAQLAQLDYWIARILLRSIIGHTGVSAFRKISYRKIRQDWGLISLLHSRNKFRKN